MSIYSPCVRCEHLGECTIRIGYASFLQVIAFRKVGSARGPTSGIRAEVTGSNPKGVAGGKIVGRSEGWQHPSTPFVFFVSA